MGIREAINKNPQKALMIAGSVGLLGLVLLVWQLWPQAAKAAAPGKAFFTSDDGQTFFEDDAWKVPPFKHEGKEAVRAHVFRCGEKGKAAVVWMERYKPEVKARIEKFYEVSANRSKFPPEYYLDAGREYKKRGSSIWKPWNTNEVFGLDSVPCRDEMAVKLTPGQQ